MNAAKGNTVRGVTDIIGRNKPEGCDQTNQSQRIVDFYTCIYYQKVFLLGQTEFPQPTYNPVWLEIYARKDVFIREIYRLIHSQLKASPCWEKTTIPTTHSSHLI